MSTRPRNNRVLRLTGVAAPMALAAVMAPTVADAHDAVVSSNPEANSTVDELPEELVLEFSGEPQEGYNTIALSRDGKSLFSEKDPSLNGRTFTVDLPDDVESEPGTYTVGYQITSSDGHATRGGYEFTVAGEAGSDSSDSGSTNSDADTEVTENEGETANTGTSVPNWLMPLGGIIVLVGALAIVIKRWRDLN